VCPKKRQVQAKRCAELLPSRRASGISARASGIASNWAFLRVGDVAERLKAAVC
jgi:hypothetical protein